VIRYRKISTSIYADGRFRRLSKPQPNAQTLWVYLLTGPHTNNIPGIVMAGPATLAERLSWPPDALRKALDEVIREGMAEADFDVPLIWLPNAIKHNIPQSVNVVKSWQITWSEIPDCNLKTLIYEQLKAFLYAFREAFGEAFEFSCPKPSAMPSLIQEQEQEQEQEQDGRRGADVSAVKSFKDRISEFCDKILNDEIIKIWREAYPGVNIEAELVKWKIHWLSNPQKAPKSNFKASFNNWLKIAARDAGRATGRKTSRKEVGGGDFSKISY